MARFRSVLSLLCILFVLFALGEARRYSYRYYRASYRYYYRYSYYRSSYYSSTTSLTRRYSSSTYRHGTSPYTRSNWYSYTSIYGYYYYTRTRRYYDNPNDMPTVCENNYDNSPNGTVYGYFICPRDDEDSDMDQCCGEDQKEYCCRQGDDPGMIIGIVVGSLIGVGVIAGVSYLIFRNSCKSSGKKKSADVKPAAPRNTVAPARTSLITVTTSNPGMQTTSFSTGYDPKVPPPSAIYNDPAYPPTGAGAYPNQPPPPYYAK